MYSAYKLNKQGDNIQPWSTPFPIWNQSVVPCLVLAVASWPAYRFLSRQVRWSGIPTSLRLFHSLLWSTQSKALVTEAEVDVFLEFSCFFYDPMDVGNLISGSSALSNSIWNFSVHILLNPLLDPRGSYKKGHPVNSDVLKFTEDMLKTPSFLDFGVSLVLQLESERLTDLTNYPFFPHKLPGDGLLVSISAKRKRKKWKQ